MTSNYIFPAPFLLGLEVAHMRAALSRMMLTCSLDKMFFTYLRKTLIPIVLIIILDRCGVKIIFWKLNPRSTTAFWMGARRYISARILH